MRKKCPKCGIMCEGNIAHCPLCKSSLDAPPKVEPKVLTAPDLETKYGMCIGDLKEVIDRAITKTLWSKNGQVCYEFDDGTQYIIPMELDRALRHYYIQLHNKMYPRK